MDFQTFFSIFERCKRENNGEGLADILKDSRKYFQNISGSESGYVLATLFDAETGILRFLQDELDKGLKLKIYETVIIQGFRLVEFIMEQFQNEYEPYIIQTKELCEFAIKIRCIHFIKKAAASVFKKIIQLFKNFELLLAETVENFGKTLHRYDEKERSEIFIIMAAVAKHNPSDVERFSSAIFKSILEDMKVQHKEDSTTQTARFQEYFEALKDLMECFTPYEDEEKNNQYYEQVYKYIKHICQFDQNSYELNPPRRDFGIKFIEKKKAANFNTRLAVELLIRHWSFFGPMIYKDYKFWQKKFEYLLKQNGKTGELGWRAMRAFYKAIAQFLKTNDSNEKKTVLLYFQEYFLNYLKRLDLNSSLLQLIVWAYSQMAAPCKIHLTTNEVYEMYTLISRRSLSLYTSDYANIEEVYSYLESISEILINLPDVSLNQIKLLSKLGILVIKRFPELKMSAQQSNATEAIIKSINNVGFLNKNFQQEYFYDLVYDGIIWTCSHTLYIDAELARTLTERPICYKNYLVLWEEILDLKYYRIGTGPQVIKYLCKELFSTCISLMNSLNLKIQTKEGTMSSDVALSMSAENETDFRIFVNMVDLYEELFKKLEFSQIQDWLPKLLYEIVKNSYKYPMVSGFYKLVHMIFLTSDTYWKSLDDQNDTFELMSKFLSSTLDLICGFYHELQIACVYLILDAPINLIQDKLKETIPVFKIALTIGLSDFSLAACALDALELWTRELSGFLQLELKEFLTEIVPNLEPYLQSKESTVDKCEKITQQKNITQINLKDDTKTLEEFQRRILLFLGSLSSGITQNFVYKRSQDTKATWDKKDLLEYTLFFPDHRLHIHFDRILPRVIELALSSGDRRTRICACEVLHSLIVIILGKTRDILNRPNPDRFAYLYKILCPAMLKLGSDTDLVVRQLYNTTLLQLTHWLSSKLMLKSPSTIYLVDALFDGLTDESNSSLRDFSGLCLKEFLDWSIKQSSDRDLVNSAVNIHTIVRKICTYALHPSMQKRIAAATAFNHLYSSLREREEILNTYWLEIFFCIVKSSQGFTDLGIENAIGHLEKVLKIKSKLFNTENSKRRKPIEFESGDLKSALIWLLIQCGSEDRYYRKRCMKLFENINPYVEGFNRGEKLVSLFLKNHGIEGFNSIFLKNLNKNILSISLETVKPLLRSLDCYIWFAEKRLIDFKLLFSDENPEKNLIFSYTIGFITCFMNRMEIEENGLLISKDLELLKSLTCETIETLFSFCHKILNTTDFISYREEIPDYFWNQDLFSLASICVLNPQKVGFDTQNLKLMESLPKTMDEFLNVLKTKVPNSLLGKFLEELLRNNENLFEKIINVENVINHKIEMELKLNVKGFTLLEKRSYLDIILKGEFYEVKKKLIEKIFNILQHQEKKSAVFLKPDTLEYLESILELVLTNYESSLINSLMSFIMNEDVISNEDMTTSQHGEYFLSVFKVPIFHGMLKNIQETMKIMENLFEKNPQKLLMIIEELTIFTHKHKKNYPRESESLANEILKRCSSLERIVMNLEHRKKQFMNIYRTVVRLKRNPLEIANNKQDLYLWILKKLQENIDLEQKNVILDAFLICLTGANNDSYEVYLILGTLKNEKSENVSENNINSLKGSACFQTMLSHLPLTKSVTLFETIITFAAGSCDQLCNEKTLIVLENYFRLITRESALKSLEVAYKAFMNCGTVTARFDILRKFLLPAFQFCKSIAIEHFFEKNAKEVYSNLTNELKADVEDDLKRLIVSKIGSYNLFEILFARVPLEKITNAESRIARNVFETPEEKELMKKLMQQTLLERKTKCLHENTKEITRLLHCAAYNCQISIISLKEEEKFYSWIFMENRQEGSLIWEKIVDCEKQYSLKQTFQEYPKQKKKLINIKKCSRSDVNEMDIISNENYIYKYDLASSTLVENIYSYDFNEPTLIQKSDQNEETMSLVFECDDFNEHECMASLSGILIHMVRNEIFIPQEDENLEFPKWMKNFFFSMKTNFNNVRLFLLKVICNTQNIFKPYGKFFIGILLNTVNEYLKQNSLNYIITDILLLLIEWQVSLPVKHVKEAQNLLEHLVQKADTSNRSVNKFNLEIIKMILQLWGNELRLPNTVDRKMESTPEFAIRLILIFLENKLQDQLVARSDLVEFMIKSFDNWQREEDVVLQNCAALGLIIKHLENENDADGEENATKLKIKEMLSSVFRKMQIADKNRLIKCINTLALRCPSLIENFFEFVRNYIKEVDNIGKAKCLEIFLLRIPNLTAEEIIRELGYLNFSYLLKNKVLTCEKLGLEIINKLVSILNAGDLLPVVDLALPYVKSDSSNLREMAYDIFIKIISKYGNVPSIEYDENKLREMSNQVLLIGLLDTAENLHEKLINFWTEEVSLPEKLVDRLLDLLKQYKPDTEQVFLLYFCLSILRLTNKSKEYDEEMFPEKLEECSFVDYEIMLHWRARNLGSIAPLFVRSLASQMSHISSQTFSQASTFSSSFTGQLLRATIAPAFEPTALEDSSFSGTQSRFSQDSNSAVFKIPDPAFNKVSKRLLNQKGTSFEILKKNVKNQLEHDEMIKEEVVRQSNVVKLYRKYRYGDFPDVQIPHKSLLVPLQELAKKDWLICKDLVVSIVCSLLTDLNKRPKNQQIISEIFNKMKEILENNRLSSSTIAAVLEITLANNFSSFQPDLVGRASKISGLYSLGALYLEKHMIYGSEISEPPRKRKREENPQSSDPSIYLAKIYRSMNEVDIVLSIFKSGQFSEKLQEASLAQSSGDFLRARKAYDEAYELETGFVKEHCLQESFECLCQLSQWEILENKVFEECQENFNSVWNDPEHEEWLLPWIFRVHLHRILKGDLFRNQDTERLALFLQSVDDWLKTDKLSQIKRRFGEEMANIFMIPEFNEKPEIARDYLKSSLDEERENWLRLNPLSEKLRSRILLKLRGISSIDLFLKTLKSSNLSKGTRNLIKEWLQNLPSPNDDLLLWETHMNYRMHFVAFLTSKFGTEDDENILHELKSSQIQQKMKFLNFAIEHRNKFIAKNYVVDLEETCKTSGIKRLELHLSVSKCYHLMGESTNEMKKKLSHISRSWKYVHNHLDSNKSKLSLKISALQHVTTLTLLLENLLDEGEKTTEMLLSLDFTSRFKDEQIKDAESFRKKMINYGLLTLKESCEIAEKEAKAECYFKLVTHCYNRVCKKADLEQFSEFVSATLKAMIHGSFKAAHYFPCLLKSEYLQNEMIKEIFIKECEKIETWLFITWQSQIFSHLGGSFSEILIPIVDRLVDDYPNAVMYSFRLTIESNPDLLMNPRILSIKQKLYNKSGVEEFLSAMHYIAQPESYLMHHLSEALKTVQQGKPVSIEKLLNILFPGENSETLLYGTLFKEVSRKIDIFKNDIKNMNDKSFVELKSLVKRINDVLKNSLDERKGNNSIYKTKLKDYSPWLQKLSACDIEVPGQYLSDRKPLTRYHAKIGKVDSHILVMKSLRSPIKITIVGNDAKNYSFLVKFGEDLRNDRRIQQAFGIMNKILQNDISCAQRHLAIDTYQVIPFSLSLGLIVWIEGMKTLEDFIHFTLTENQERQCDAIAISYDNWIKKSSAGKRSLAYKESLIKYGALQVISKMNEFINMTEWDALRKTFFTLSPSVESFLSLRHNFVSTYGTICTAQWILGIGDRHLENLLISIKSGRCLGIDFGYAFGAGVDISIPELIPFRLTPQIQGLFKPFDNSGPFETTMIYVLKALRKEKGPLLACLDVFIHEPLNWLEHINELSRENQEESEGVNWLPIKRLATVAQKLDGKKPSSITLEQLKSAHGSQKYFWRYIDIVQGTEEDHKTLRAKINQDNLTSEEQVKCLIDQASDLNILGRTFSGWQPWM